MLPVEVDLALAAPSALLVGKLLSLHEGQWFDRKSGRIQPKDLAVPLVAFANAEGGVIVVGLHDNRVDSATLTPERLNSLSQASFDYTRPPVRARTEVISAPAPDGSDARLLVIRVEPGETVHETSNGDCYLRIGDESRKLGFAERQELTYDRGHAPFDGSPIPAGRDELDEGSLTEYCTLLGARRGPDRVLRARSLLRDDDRLTVAAYLLFGRAPGERMPNAHVRVLRYTDTVRGSGSRLSLDADFDRRCEGAIPHVIEEAAAAVEEAMPRRRALATSGRFEAIPMVPRDAWLEGLVNAVVHRSYSAAGDHIRVEVFPNRIEIESPGRFPGIVDPARPLDVRRYARNPRIARVCADLNIGRELGEGIHRMFDEMRLAGLTDPAYDQTPQTTRLILSASAAIPAAVRDRMPRGAERILVVLRGRGPMSTGDIVSASGLSRPTVKKALDILADNGFVEWSGTSARDPRATWEMR